MRNKSIKIIGLLFVLGISIFIFDSTNVYADTDYVEGWSTTGSACSQGNCYTGTVGIRITIVDKNGKRCRYNNFRTKQEFVTDKGNGITKKCNTVYNKKYKLSATGLPNPGSDKYPSSWDHGECFSNCNKAASQRIYIDKTRNPKNTGIIMDYLMCKAGNKDKKVSDCGSVKKGNAVFNSILNMAFYNDKDKGIIDIGSISSSNLSNTYIQFEQLVQMGNYYIGNGYGSCIVSTGANCTKLITMGTVAEASYLYTLKNQTSSNGAPNYYGGCIDPIHTQTGVASCGSYASGVGFYSGFTSDKNVGLTVKKSINLDNLTQSDSLNVSHFWLGEIEREDCEDIVKANGKKINGKVVGVDYNQSKWKNKPNDYGTAVYNSLKNKSGYEWMSLASNYGFTTSEQLYKHIKNSCNKPTCEQAYSIYSDKSAFKNKLKNTTFFDYDDSVKAARAILAKGDAAWNLDIDSKYITIKNNACGATPCGTLLGNLKDIKFEKLNTDNKNKIKYLFQLFPKNGYLNLELLELLNAKPHCDPFDVDCPESVTGGGYCEGKVTFSDTTKIEDCIKKGIAYSKTGIASSKDSYLTSTCKKDVYCSETVEFKLPSKPETITAGRVFKWGVTTMKDNVLATMIVKKTCYATSCGSVTSINPANWAKDIKTEMKLHYKEPVSGTNLTSTITAKLKSITLKGKNLNINSPSYNCNGNCFNKLSMKNGFTTTAEYDFNYGNDLRWYADKKDNDKLKPYNNTYETPDNKPYYVSIGYGLPTYFTTPNVTHSIQKDGAYYWDITKSSSKGAGYLYMDIDKIGTHISGDKYHFTSLIKGKSKENKKSSAFQDDLFKYACDYSVKNEITGSECIGKSPNKPSYCKPDESPKGIDVVFRTVELINNNASKAEKDNQITKAFPGRSGNGRAIGRNWATLGSTEEQNKVEIAKILRNTIYTEKSEPMYKISLGPSEITKIRNDNKILRNFGVDPFTYILAGSISGVSDSGWKMR